jgi:hypothetical protein
VTEPIDIGELILEPWPWAVTNPAALAYWTCADLRGGPARRGPEVRSMEGMLEAVRAGGAYWLLAVACLVLAALQ